VSLDAAMPRMDGHSVGVQHKNENRDQGHFRG
jgi:hypothetical protein